MDDRLLQRLDPAEFYRRFAESGARPDGRAPLQPRPVAVSAGGFGTADGAASVRLGGTAVVATVMCEPRGGLGGGGGGGGVVIRGAAGAPRPPVAVSALVPEFRGGRVQAVANSPRAQDLAALITQVLLA